MNTNGGKKVRFSGPSIYLKIAPVTAEESVMTKTTAAPIPVAVLVFFDTPRNGQSPKN